MLMPKCGSGETLSFAQGDSSGRSCSEYEELPTGILVQNSGATLAGAGPSKQTKQPSSRRQPLLSAIPTISV